jgi:hypothetical protein
MQKKVPPRIAIVMEFSPLRAKTPPQALLTKPRQTRNPAIPTLKLPISVILAASVAIYESYPPNKYPIS